MRPRFSLAQIDHLRVRLVKLDTKIAQHRVPKPGDVAGRFLHQLVVRTELMFMDELLEIRLRNQLRRWVPDKFAAELKLAHEEVCVILNCRATASVASISGGARACSLHCPSF